MASSARMCLRDSMFGRYKSVKLATRDPVKLKWKALILLLGYGFLSIGAASTCNKPLKEESLQACSQDPDWLIRYAAMLNAKERYTEAADLLEGVLMQHPEASGAAEQYNKALAGIDSREVKQPVQQHAPLDVLPQQWQVNSSLQMRTGYSDNLNQAPTQPNIQLTLPAGPVAVELQPQFQRQAGFGVESQLASNAMRRLTDKLQWQVRGELFGRETEYGGYASYQGTNLLTTLTQNEDDGRETGLALGFNALRYDADVYLYAGQLMLRHSGKKWGYCQPQIGGDFLWQRQHGRPILDSRYTGLIAGLACDTTIGFYSAVLSGGWDWASGQRPGGDQGRGKLEVNGIWAADAINQNSFVKAYANIFESNDTQSYSPWLSSGATRYISRLGVGLDYDWPLNVIADNWRGVTSVKWQHQNSNISLFEMDTFEGWMGVRVVW